MKPVSQLFLSRFLGRANFERHVQRAKTDQASYDKDNCQDAQNDGRSTCNVAGQIKNDHQDGQRDSNNPIYSSHVLFHMFLLPLNSLKRENV
jgi:hypothetical protein